MSVASLTIALVGLPFAFLAFELVAKLGYGPYFKHQETLATASGNAAVWGWTTIIALVLDEGYRPWRSVLRMAPWALVAMLLASSLYTGLFGSTGQAIGAGPFVAEHPAFWRPAYAWGSASPRPGSGPSGGLMAPESLLVPESHYRKLRIPRITQKNVPGVVAGLGHPGGDSDAQCRRTGDVVGVRLVGARRGPQAKGMGPARGASAGRSVPGDRQRG